MAQHDWLAMEMERHREKGKFGQKESKNEREKKVLLFYPYLIIIMCLKYQNKYINIIQICLQFFYIVFQNISLFIGL